MTETVEAQKPTETPKKEKIAVTMSDTRIVEFGQNQRVLKDLLIEDGVPTGVRFDFANGETRTVLISEVLPLHARLAVHGLAQKLGDEYSGEKTVDDCLLVFDNLAKELRSGVFNPGRSGDSLSGAGTLAKAVVEAFGIEMDQARETLKSLSAKEKLALRDMDGVKEVIARLEAEKATKAKEGVNTQDLLAKFASKS